MANQPTPTAAADTDETIAKLTQTHGPNGLFSDNRSEDSELDQFRELKLLNMHEVLHLTYMCQGTSGIPPTLKEGSRIIHQQNIPICSYLFYDKLVNALEYIEGDEFHRALKEVLGGGKINTKQLVAEGLRDACRTNPPSTPRSSASALE